MHVLSKRPFTSHIVMRGGGRGLPMNAEGGGASTPSRVWPQAAQRIAGSIARLAHLCVRVLL
eukprot:7389727-Prymnesium_polylepis.1